LKKKRLRRGEEVGGKGTQGRCTSKPHSNEAEGYWFTFKTYLGGDFVLRESGWGEGERKNQPCFKGMSEKGDQGILATKKYRKQKKHGKNETLRDP